MKAWYWLVVMGLGLFAVVCLSYGASGYFPKQGQHGLLNSKRRVR
jgi:hypothetical protein